MTLPLLLQRFHHLALTASCVCLIVALSPILPRLGPFLWLVPMLILLAGRLQGRWMLADWLANLLALLATSFCLIWIYQNWTTLALRPMPIALIPYIGPLLLLLLLLRLYRPHSPRDLWLLQGMGLLQVALACTLTTELLFGLLLLLYLALVLPLLSLAQLDQARRWADLPDDAPLVPRLLARTCAWTLTVFVFALALFFLTPRLTWESWDPFRQLGVRLNRSTERNDFASRIDLTRTGTVKLGTGDAFEVRVVPGEDGIRPLPLDIHWRTGVLNTYYNGTWVWNQIGFPGMGPAMETLPDLGPGAVTLEFQVQAREAGGLPLAEPVLFASWPNRRTVAFGNTADNPFMETEGTMLATNFRTRPYLYRQVTIPTLNRWPLRVPPPIPEFERRDPRLGLLRVLRANPLPALTEWTHDRLRQIAREGRFGLRPEHLQPDEELPSDQVPTHAEPIAWALTAYLARSGEYTYTLDLRSEDSTLDPTLDFLWNVRQGHCERFASALALMLRTQGIPSRVVRGFRGYRQERPDRYIVPQQQAHAWVEALVPGRGHPGLDWITLEPTPDTDGVLASAFSLWDAWERFATWQQNLWRNLIVGYDANQQAAFWHSWVFTTLAPYSLLAGVLLGGLLALVFWLRRRRQPPPVRDPLASVPFLQRLWLLLQQHRLLTHAPYQTPQELAEQAAQNLAARADTAALADLPARLVALFYRLRFGGHPVSEDQLHQAEAEVAALDAILNPAAPAPA